MMAHESIEERARMACLEGQYELATQVALEGYSREIYGFLLAKFRGQSTYADDVFSEFCETLWSTLSSFQWRCSIRSWCYSLARSSASRHQRTSHHQCERTIPLSAAPWIEHLTVQLRTSTRPHLKSEVKDEFQRLRERLSEDDQDLLILRVDRGMAWHDIAHAMLSSEAMDDDDSTRRVEAALRQRFVEVKRRLKHLATEAGLL